MNTIINTIKNNKKLSVIIFMTILIAFIFLFLILNFSYAISNDENTNINQNSNEKKYTITYYGNGGKYNGNQYWEDPTKVIYGDNYRIYSNDNFFVRKGYDFVGWTTNSNGIDDGYSWIGWDKNGSRGTWTFDNGDYGIADNKLDLYAMWEPKEYTIKYDCGDGTFENQTVKYNEKFKIQNFACSKNGYVYERWLDTTNNDWDDWVGKWYYDNGEYGIENNTLTLVGKLKSKTFVYYDPVNNSTCNENNYWTKYNSNTTCYRFTVIDKINDKLKIMLDHNISTAVYNDYPAELANTTLKWKEYNNDIDIIDENDVKNYMELTQLPTRTKKEFGKPWIFFVTEFDNTLDDFWIKGDYSEDSNYAYKYSHNGYNEVSEKSKNLGIRPVITVDIEKIYTTSKSQILPTNQENANLVTEYSSNTYPGLQGFTITSDNRLVFYVTNNGDNIGRLSITESNNFSKISKEIYLDSSNNSDERTNIGHGNDMTFNSKTNKIIITRTNSSGKYDYLNQYATDLKFEKQIKNENNNSGIAYDQQNNYYFGRGANNQVVVLNENFEKVNSFTLIASETNQGIEYHDGYLFLTTSYTHDDDYYSSIIYVYNVKYNNGTPSKDFGKFVKKLYIPKNYGEIESISFNNNKVFFGFSNWPVKESTDEYGYKWYSVPYENIKEQFNPDYLNFSKDVQIDNNNNIIKRIKINTIYNDLLSTNGNVVIKDFNENELKMSDVVKTGSTIEIKMNGKSYSYKTSVLGDITQTGIIDNGDVKLLYDSLKGKNILNDFQIAAGDIINDDCIKINDITKLYRFYRKLVNSLD